MYRVPAIRPYPAHSLTFVDDANDPNSNMLEAQDGNMRDAQQADRTPAKMNDRQTNTMLRKSTPRNAMMAAPRNEKSMCTPCRKAYLLASQAGSCC